MDGDQTKDNAIDGLVASVHHTSAHSSAIPACPDGQDPHSGMRP